MTAILLSLADVIVGACVTGFYSLRSRQMDYVNDYYTCEIAPNNDPTQKRLTSLNSLQTIRICAVWFRVQS